MSSVTIYDPNKPAPESADGKEWLWVKQTGQQDVDFNTHRKYYLSPLYPVYDSENEETVSAGLETVNLRRIVKNFSYADGQDVSASIESITIRNIILEEEAPAEEEQVSVTIESIVLREPLVEPEPVLVNTEVSATLETINLREDVVVNTSLSEETEVSATLTSIQLI